MRLQRPTVLAGLVACLAVWSAVGVSAQGSPGTDILPGVDLVTEVVEPGVYRVVSDGPHDLTRNVWDIVITPGGEAWVAKHHVEYGPQLYRDDRVRVSYRDARVLRLGEPGAMHRLSDDATARMYLHLDRQGDVSAHGTRTVVGVWRDGAWQESNARYCEGPISDGICWHGSGDGSRISQIDADGSERFVTHEDLGLDPDAGFGLQVAVGSDGTVWTDTYDSRTYRGNPDAVFTGLARYDGERWATVEADDPISGWVEDLDVAPDGTVWVALHGSRSPNALTVARWDGAAWATYGPLEGPRWLTTDRDIHFATDGKTWFDALTFHDGDDLRQLEISATLMHGDLRVGPHAFGPDGSVWVILIDMRDPKSLGCEVEPDKCQGVGALYIIAPDAVAASE